MYFIGIDIGTSSICGVVYDSLTKEIVSTTKENDTNIATSNSWENIQDTTAIIHIVYEIVREFQSRYPDIKGIGVSGQMHGIVYVNRQGNAVSPLYTWRDSRANQIYQKDQSYATYLTETTGYPVATGYGLATHFYNLTNGEVPANAVKLCTIMDYVVMKLSGRNTPLTDYSNAASMGFYHKEQLVFDTQALQKVGIDISILPETNESASFAGSFEGIPVYSAIGDNQASFLGSVHDVEHSIHVTVGTSSQISIYSDAYIEVESLDTRPLPGGGYILVGATLCGGSSFAMLKTFFTNVLKLFTGNEMSSADLYQRMISIPYKTYAKDDLTIETLFDGTRLHPDKRGQIANISLSNLTPENIILGFVKGVCEALYNYYKLIPESIRKEKTMLVGSGNGIKKNSLFCKAFEERFQCPMHLSNIQEEAAFGACICGMVGGKYTKNFMKNKP